MLKSLSVDKPNSFDEYSVKSSNLIMSYEFFIKVRQIKSMAQVCSNRPGKWLQALEQSIQGRVWDFVVRYSPNCAYFGWFL